MNRDLIIMLGFCTVFLVWVSISAIALYNIPYLAVIGVIPYIIVLTKYYSDKKRYENQAPIIPQQGPIQAMPIVQGIPQTPNYQQPNIPQNQQQNQYAQYAQYQQ